jgi:hypothetical protein
MTDISVAFAQKCQCAERADYPAKKEETMVAVLEIVGPQTQLPGAERKVAMPSFDSRKFVFIYKGRLDCSKYNTEERLRGAGAFLLGCFETHIAYQHVVGDEVDIDAQEGIIELGCTLLGVGPTQEAALVEYLKRCVSYLNSLDDQHFAQLGW